MSEILYVPSTGKIEIAGKLEDGAMLFKFHQAKHNHDAGRIFYKKPSEGGNMASGQPLMLWYREPPEASAE